MFKDNRIESCARLKAWSKSTEPRFHGLVTSKRDTLSLSRPLNSLQGSSFKQASNVAASCGLFSWPLPLLELKNEYFHE